MNIDLKCLLINKVLHSFAFIIASVLSELLVMLTIDIVSSCTYLERNRDLHCNLTKNDYFLKILLLV